MTNEELLVTGALKAWQGTIERANKAFGNLSADELQKEISPGKNRLIYLWGHLTAVHDAMLPLLRVGERQHPEYDELFLAKPDRSAANLPSAEELKKAWNEVNQKLTEEFAKLKPADWLQRHAAVSEEDFAKEPLRNRFAILVSRTSHVAYHLGQVVLAPK